MAHVPGIMLKVSLDIHRDCIDTVSYPYGMVTWPQDMLTCSHVNSPLRHGTHLHDHANILPGHTKWLAKHGKII
jgi:hypothetical protein